MKIIDIKVHKRMKISLLIYYDNISNLSYNFTCFLFNLIPKNDIYFFYIINYINS